MPNVHKLSITQVVEIQLMSTFLCIAYLSVSEAKTLDRLPNLQT